jgi:arsenate reductase (glutaredoxin)
MNVRVYAYRACETCRRALKWLAARGVAHEVVAIRERPPTLPELRAMLAISGEVRRLFNSSGGDYKALGLRERLGSMSEAEALALLSENGNLVKRPFVLAPNGGAVGFKPEEWEQIFASLSASAPPPEERR